jgi:hypothetical protein
MILLPRFRMESYLHANRCATRRFTSS